MALDRGFVDRLTPPDEPEPSLLPRGYRASVYREGWAREDQLLRRTVLWCAAMESAFVQSGLWLQVPGFKYASYGFADVDVEEDFFFGVVMHVRSDVDEPQRRIVGRIEVGEYSFPVSMHSPSTPPQLHGYPTEHHANGTSACCADINSGASQHGSQGILTAGHLVAGSPVGAKVDVTTGAIYSVSGRATVLAVGSPHVDVAVLSPTQLYNPQAALNVRRHVAPGLPVTFRGQVSGVVTTTVLRIGPSLLSLDANYNSIGFHAWLSDHGRDGDSGALLKADDGTGDAIALYLGANESLIKGNMIGKAQVLRQIALALDLTLYDFP